MRTTKSRNTWVALPSMVCLRKTKKTAADTPHLALSQVFDKFAEMQRVRSELDWPSRLLKYKNMKFFPGLAKYTLHTMT